MWADSQAEVMKRIVKFDGLDEAKFPEVDEVVLEAHPSADPASPEAAATLRTCVHCAAPTAHAHALKHARACASVPLAATPPSDRSANPAGSPPCSPAAAA